MLKQLLAEIASGRNHRLSELAARLNTSEGMIEQMMVDLERRGLIVCETAVPGACPSCRGACASCALHDPARRRANLGPDTKGAASPATRDRPEWHNSGTNSKRR